MAGKKDWGTLIRQQRQASEAENKNKFKSARAALEILPESLMSPTGSTNVSREETEYKQQDNNEKTDDIENIVVDIDLLESNPFNARYFYDDNVIIRLAESLKMEGQKQPIIITNNPNKPGCFYVIDGEYRFRASKTANLKTIRCDYYHDVTQDGMYHLSNLLNEQRTSQTVFDNARAWQKLLDENIVESSAMLAEYLEKTPAVISKTLKLNSLPIRLAQMLATSEKPIGLNSAYEFTLLAQSINDAQAYEIAQQLSIGDIGAKDVERLKKAFTEQKKERSLRNNMSAQVFKIGGKKVGVLKFDNKRLMLDVSLPEGKSSELASQINDLLSQYTEG
jgi:ParB family chromosome partitioning protein